MSTLKLPQYLQIPHSASERKQAQRLFHGRGHAYEGLQHTTIDWLPPVILISLFAPVSNTEITDLAHTLRQKFPECRSIQQQNRYQLSGPMEVIWGESIQHLTIIEGNLQFHIHLGKTRNTGLFLDMKNGRTWVQQHSRHKRVLNLFAYTCGFSVAALAGHAKSVLNVDMSRPALTIGRENHRLNRQALTQVRFEKLNIFKSFSRFKKRGPFDLLICDPPTLQKGSVDIVQDYPKILRRLDQFMAPEADLLLCLNAPELGADFLHKHMAKLAPQYRCIAEIKPPPVYVDAEDKGLKVLHFKAALP